MQAKEELEAERKNAEDDKKARRRMLGNIQFIGHLYRSSLLTERIMHQCMTQLLQVSAAQARP